MRFVIEFNQILFYEYLSEMLEGIVTEQSCEAENYFGRKLETVSQ